MASSSVASLSAEARAEELCDLGTAQAQTLLETVKKEIVEAKDLHSETAVEEIKTRIWAFVTETTRECDRLRELAKKYEVSHKIEEAVVQLQEAQAQCLSSAERGNTRLGKVVVHLQEAQAQCLAAAERDDTRLDKMGTTLSNLAGGLSIKLDTILAEVGGNSQFLGLQEQNMDDIARKVTAQSRLLEREGHTIAGKLSSQTRPLCRETRAIAERLSDQGEVLSRQAETMSSVVNQVSKQSKFLEMQAQSRAEITTSTRGLCLKEAACETGSTPQIEAACQATATATAAAPAFRASGKPVSTS
ncbi:hypothetical protein F5Y17DRAFT_463906 [Xylariaceae sp. FL0594]|nr:hypothetical protein F5Y17DRAFT_463906 [Xylariaceae sp. FL0594]